MLGQEVAEFDGFDNDPKIFILSIFRWVVVVVSNSFGGEFSPNGDFVFQNRKKICVFEDL
jgi:hypothetical protein